MSIPPGLILLGAPRSGTTWLQSMLGSHPRIATPQELHLFSDYLHPLWTKWRRHLDYPVSDRRTGLSNCFTEEEFEDSLRGIVAQAYGNILKAKPGASVVLDKSPSYASCATFIHLLVPEVRFVHLIRDGRDVVSSLVRAGEGWGRGWAPKTIQGAAVKWRDRVTASRELRTGSAAYMEVRYENLLEASADVLMDVFRFLDLPYDEAFCLEVAANHTFERMQASGGADSSLIRLGEQSATSSKGLQEPEGFLREGRSGTWADHFTAFDRWNFDQVAGQLLCELGYADDGWTRVSPVRAGLFAGWHALRRMAPERPGVR